jgi:hypothetical protein
VADRPEADGRRGEELAHQPRAAQLQLLPEPSEHLAGDRQDIGSDAGDRAVNRLREITWRGLAGRRDDPRPAGRDAGRVRRERAGPALMDTHELCLGALTAGASQVSVTIPAEGLRRDPYDDPAPDQALPFGDGPLTG